MEGTAALVELVLVFGAVLGFAVWEVWKLRRERRKDDQDAAG